MKQQVVELCRSDTLSRVRQQHDRDLTVMKEQHDKALLTLQQKLDSTAQALDEQVHSGDRRGRAALPKASNSKLSFLWSTLLPGGRRSAAERAGEAAGAEVGGRATGESASCQRPHSTSGGESAAVRQAAGVKSVIAE